MPKISFEKKVHNNIAKNPGSRAEEITRTLRCDPKETSKALRKLVDDGYLTQRGVTRATTYTVTMKVLD